MYPKAPVFAYLGMASEPAISGQECTVEFLATPEMTNPAGVVQSGLLAAMAESACGLLAGAMLDARQRQRTVEIGLRPLSPVRPGARVIVCAVVTQRSAASLSAEARLFDADEHEVATAWVRKAIEPNNAGA